MPIAPGANVTPRIMLLEPLSEGGMGSVWVAEHLTLGTKVAVKFIIDEGAHDPDLKARFRQEATAAAKINSPYVVQMLDHGVMDDGTPFMVMELLDGESLGARMGRVGRLQVRQAALVLAPTALALDAAHEKEVVHRDIKPDNIFLVPQPDGSKLIKVLDFGVARHTGQDVETMDAEAKLTMPGMFVGTPWYVCRDQIILGQKPDFRTDLWALAVVTYEMLTDELPFLGETVGQICTAISNLTYKPPSELVEKLPPQIDGWFERAFHPNPEARFSSGRDMALAFVRLVPEKLGDLERQLSTNRAFSGYPSEPADRADVHISTIPPNPLPGDIGVWEEISMDGVEPFSGPALASTRPAMARPPITGAEPAAAQERPPREQERPTPSTAATPVSGRPQRRRSFALATLAAVSLALGVVGAALLGPRAADSPADEAATATVSTAAAEDSAAVSEDGGPGASGAEDDGGPGAVAPDSQTGSAVVGSPSRRPPGYRPPRKKGPKDAWTPSASPEELGF